MRTTISFTGFVPAAVTGASAAGQAQESGRLLATSGVTQLEGAGGGGLAPWALVTGYGTRDAIGANVHYTSAYLPSFNLQSAGVSVGVMDRLELSYAHQWFNTGSTGAKLGLGSGYTFDLDIVGAKVRLFDDAVYDQDSWLPKGPCVYHGRPMATSHAELNLSRAKFNAVAENLQAAVKRAGIPYWTRNRLMVPLAPMQRDVVTQ